MSATDEAQGIAIIGMGGRFPGAADIDTFWQRLCAGEECLTRFTTAELRSAEVPESLLNHPHYVPVNGVLNDVDLFDAAFFGVNPREASITDPQHRVFLELAWHALEHSGYDPATYQGIIGVYAGCGLSSYLLHNLWSNRAALADTGELRARMANSQEYLATRVSYKLNLTGPSININTACSTSLVAVHMACDALLNYQCDMALGGGISIQVPQVKGYLYEEGGILSPDGHCRAFDSAAQGTVSGNGGAVVVLKRLADALADGDTVYAVLRGSAINNDGADKAGYTAPSVSGQARVIEEAQAVAGIDVETIGYVETHGTGTPLGDPIELAALTQAFRTQTTRTQFCAIGSVKTNVGHLDEAAGVTGLIKTVLSLYHHQIPPSLHFKKPNPEINFAASPFYVNTELRHWPPPPNGAPRRAAVSSFGIGGTNAHVVLEEAPSRQASGRSRSWQLLAISARTRTALAALAGNLAKHLEANPDQPLADVCYTLQVGRTPLAVRRAVPCHDAQDAIAELRRIEARQIAEPLMNPQGGRPVAFLFPGQGVQYVGMGGELYETEPKFREEMDRCAERLAPLLGCDVREMLYPRNSASSRSPEERRAQVAAGAEHLSQTAIAQPVLFSFQYALARLWISWGVGPRAMLGHSLGQYVAATLAGVLALEDALDLVAARGRLLQQVEPGGMLAVGLTESELQPLLGSSLSLAAVNAPSMCVASGPMDAIAVLEEELARRDVFHRRLQTSHAFHSAMVQPAVDAFAQLLRQVELKPPQLPFLSNVSGTWITADEATDPEYWARHMQATVRFSENVEELLRSKDLLLLEIGPGQTLATTVKRHASAAGRNVLSCTAHPHSNESAAAVLMGAVGQLWEAGGQVDWQKFHAHHRRQRLPLPTYPFERQRYWIDPLTGAAAEMGGPTSRALVAATERRRPRSEGPNAADTNAVPPVDVDRPECDYVEEWFRVPAWRSSESRASERLGAPACWLVFVDEVGLASSLSERLRSAGNTVVEVAAGDRFKRLGPESFVIAPARAEDYAALWKELLAVDRRPACILHLWNVTRHGASWCHMDDHSYYSLLFLAQTIGSQPKITDLKIDVISNGLHRVDDGDTVCAEKALLLGPVQVMPLEYPRWCCRSIDVVLDESNPKSVQFLADRIFVELSDGGDDTIVALRGNRRCIPTLVPVRDKPMTARLRERGVYLITGGLGSMGLALAQHLAEKVQARLVLVGRSTPYSAAARLPSSEARFVEWESRRERELGIRAIDSYDNLEAVLNDLCTSLAWEYFTSRGGGLQPGKSFHRDVLRSRLGVLPKFKRFFERLLSILTAAEIVQVTNDVVIRTTLEPRHSAGVRREIEQRFPSFAGLARLLSHCASQYGRALSGEIEAISVLYPDGTSSFLDECLHGTAECTNDRLYVQLVADILADLPSTDRPLKILEVGGGSGSLTRVVVDRLRGRSVEYWFTDLGRSFVVAAQREAVEQGIEFMRFSQLDISRDPGAQGFAETGFDAVIGYNVVHATPDIVQCLGHLAGLLAPGGLLMLAETVRHRHWIDMIWGLAEAWWCYQDEALRGGGPLLTLDAWQRALATQHFENVITLPSDGERRVKTDSGLVLAQRPLLASSEDSRSFMNDEMRRKLRKLEDIERAGGEVLVAQADVTDKSQMRKVVEQARQRFGAIHGVIHAAGVLGQRLIHTQSGDPASAVLAPKVTGTRVLESVLGEQDLDFFVMCSSMASTRPIAGQVDYCAANAFLDAFAQEWTRGSTRCMSIDWGFWQELGMIEHSNMPQSQKQEIIDEIRRKGWSQAGVAAFDHILQCDGVRQVLVSPEFAQGTPAPGTILSHPWFESRQVEATGLESYIAHLSPNRHWVLDEHRVRGKPTLPGTAYLEMARAAFIHRDGEGPVELRNVYFLSPLILEPGEARETRTILKPQREGCTFHVVSRVGGDRWEEHARGEVLRPLRTTTDPVGNELTERCRRLEAAVRPHDDGFAQRVAAYPPRWRNIMRFQFEDDQGLALIQLPHPFVAESADYGLHPALLDNATGFLSHRENLESSLPFCYQRVAIHGPLPTQFFSHVRRAENGQLGMRKYDVLLFDSQGAILVQIHGFTMREVEVESRTSRQFHGPDNAPPAENFHIDIASPGHLESLRFVAAPRREPGEGELEIEVAAAGLNFIEVLYALDMLPTPPGLQVRFGLECSGRVTKVGPHVKSFAVGDEVMAMSPRAFSRYTLAPVGATARKPSRLSFLDAATLPAAYATAWYSLIMKANLRPGERVLIHSAAGGVGLAAVHIARHIGGEVFATAGNEEKRDYLRNLGIQHVMDSRSLRFVDDIKSQTRGEGVDVVVNSLGGEFIAGGLSVLRRYGRFLELGKRDIFKGTKLDLQHFEKHLSFMAIDVGPDLPDFESLWRDVVQRFHDGTLPPLPHQEFPITALAPAMEFMAQAKHIGKIVLEVAGCRVTPTGLVGAPVGLPLAEIIGPLESTLDRSTVSPRPPLLVAGHSRPELETPYRVPRNDTEKQLVAIWQQLLGIDRVGVDDNFFDLHGDSLLAAQLVSRVQRVLHVALPISLVFDATTVASQAERINQLRQPIARLEPATSATVEHEEGNI